MYAFIDTVDEHIKSNHINFKGIEISSTLFPRCFNEAVLQSLEENNTNPRNEVFADKYMLKYDNESNLCFIACAPNDEYNRIVVFSDTACFTRYYKGKKMCERTLLRLADRIDYQQNNKYIKEMKTIESIMYRTAEVVNEYIDYVYDDCIERTIR